MTKNGPKTWTPQTYTVTLDDDPMISRIVEKFLGISSLAYETIADLEQDLPKLNPEAFFIDVHLKEECGLDIIPKLRLQFPETPLIVASSGTDAQLISRALASGANDFISKPLKKDEIVSRFLIRKQERQDAASMNAELAMSKQVKDQLLRMVVHDITNPLCLIKGVTEIALNNQENAQINAAKLWGKIDKAANMLHEVVSLARELEAAKSGKLKFELQSIPLKPILDDCVFLFEQKLQHKNIQLDICSSICDETMVVADPAALKNQIFANLISNAIKFTPQNGKINVKARNIQDRLCIEIIDSGIGIPQNLLPQLFEFDRATNRRGTDGERGTGFGLPLVKSYLEFFNAEIAVASKVKEDFPEDHGTTFSLVFNRAA